MVCRIKKFDHITPTMKKLHWLPVAQRIDFKINLLTYKALNDEAPVYVRDLLTPYQCSRNVRSNNQYLLRIPKYKCETFGGISFAVAAPKEWNKLPLNIRKAESTSNFKTALKTHLFSLAYN